MALIVIFGLSTIDVAFLSTKDHGHLFRITKIWITLTTRSGYSLTLRGTQQQNEQHLCTSDIDCAVTALHTTGRPILTAPQLHSTPAASCNRIVISGKLCWKILLLLYFYHFHSPGFFISKTESKPASRCFYKERDIFEASKTTTKTIRISCWLSYWHFVRVYWSNYCNVDCRDGNIWKCILVLAGKLLHSQMSGQGFAPFLTQRT